MVITNQAGIGRGFYSENDFLELTEWMKQEFMIRNAKIDAVYYCPHHPREGIGKFKQDCVCRKPKPGMFLQAINELNLDTHSSIMLGDNESDLIVSRLSGIGYNLLYSVGRQHEDFVIHSLNEAAAYLLGSIQDTLL